MGFGIEAKGRSGREIGKCGFASVGGADDLVVPMARGEETEGREYIMAGSWREREDIRNGGGRRESRRNLPLEGGGGVGGQLSNEGQLRADI